MTFNHANMNYGEDRDFTWHFIERMRAYLPALTQVEASVAHFADGRLKISFKGRHEENPGMSPKQNGGTGKTSYGYGVAISLMFG